MPAAPTTEDPAGRKRSRPPLDQTPFEKPNHGAARILIASVGYECLRDLSVGPLVLRRLREQQWPDGVELEDLSYGPIGVMHNLEARPPYDRIVLLAGVGRNRQPGRVYSYSWNRELPHPEELQARVAEATTGVISLDNLLIIATYFDKLPRDVVVVEVEALNGDWGAELSPEVARAMPLMIGEVRKFSSLANMP